MVINFDVRWLLFGVYFVERERVMEDEEHRVYV
jgi:hypothetical protein